MLWARSKVIEIYLGNKKLGMAVEHLETCWYSAESIDAVLQVFIAVLEEKKYSSKFKLRIWLSVDLVSPFVLSADCGAKNFSEAVALSKVMANNLLKSENSLVWLNDWCLGKECAVVSLSQDLLNRLESICREKRLKIFSVRPWWNIFLDFIQTQNKNSSDALSWSIAEPDGMTLGLVVKGRLVDIDSFKILSHDPNWSRTRQRASMSAGANTKSFHAEFVVDNFPKKNEEAEKCAIGYWKKIDLMEQKLEH